MQFSYKILKHIRLRHKIFSQDNKKYHEKGVLTPVLKKKDFEQKLKNKNATIRYKDALKKFLRRSISTDIKYSGQRVARNGLKKDSLEPALMENETHWEGLRARVPPPGPYRRYVDKIDISLREAAKKSFNREG